jgi:hypothetical protein
MESPDTLKRIIAQRLDDEVLDALDQLFPERTPELGDSIDQIRYASGQRSVIRFLRGLTIG